MSINLIGCDAMYKFDSDSIVELPLIINTLLSLDVTEQVMSEYPVNEDILIGDWVTDLFNAAPNDVTNLPLKGSVIKTMLNFISVRGSEEPTVWINFTTKMITFAGRDEVKMPAFQYDHCNTKALSKLIGGLDDHLVGLSQRVKRGTDKVTEEDFVTYLNGIVTNEPYPMTFGLLVLSLNIKTETFDWIKDNIDLITLTEKGIEFTTHGVTYNTSDFIKEEKSAMSGISDIMAKLGLSR